MNVQEVPEDLLDEAEELSKLDEHQLYIILGNQLLWQMPPRKIAELASHISGMRELTEIAETTDTVPSERLIPELTKMRQFFDGVVEIGKRYIKQTEGLLREAICTKEGKCKEQILKVMDQGVRVVLAVVARSVLQKLDLQPTLYPIAVTMSLIILKKGFEAFCEGTGEMKK